MKNSLFFERKKSGEEIVFSKVQKIAFLLFFCFFLSFFFFFGKLKCKSRLVEESGKEKNTRKKKRKKKNKKKKGKEKERRIRCLVRRQLIKNSLSQSGRRKRLLICQIKNQRF